MKKILFSILVLAGITATAQVKVGTNPTSIDNSAMLQVDTTTKGFLPPRMTTAERTAITSPAKGLVIYNTTKDCLEINQGTPAAPTWECIGASVTPSVAANCTTAGFNAGTYISGTALSGRTYSVTLTNNSFASATIAFSAADLTLSDPSLIVGTPTGSPALSGGNATIASGASVVITYPITGTPSVCGTLSGTWTKLSLNCTKTVAVNPNVSCTSASWTTAISPLVTGGLTNGTAYSGAYSVPYTGGGCTLAADSSTIDGLTLSYSGGAIGAAGNLVYDTVLKKCVKL
jgi:hypothetical protein